ncbi:MAG: hypothetical protein JSU59_01530 [Nitrospirota bacterium]|nr:MAG: hypothetical protein JSU59_01530 [Nitrospirota bacterium]
MGLDEDPDEDLEDEDSEDELEAVGSDLLELPFPAFLSFAELALAAVLSALGFPSESAFLGSLSLSE